jgi:hypothetical protein
MYERLVKNVCDIGSDANPRVLKQWEDPVECLRRDCLSTEELNIEMGRPSNRMKIAEPAEVSGSTVGWGFEGKWDVGPGLEADDDVAPEGC